MCTLILRPPLRIYRSHGPRLRPDVLSLLQLCCITPPQCLYTMTLCACSGTLRAILSTGIWDYVWKSLTALVAIGAAIFVSVSRQDSTSPKSRFSTPGLTQAPGQVRNGKLGFVTKIYYHSEE